MFLYYIFLITTVTPQIWASVVRSEDLHQNGAHYEDIIERYKRQDTVSPQDGKCILPYFPEYGSYTVGGLKDVHPGRRYMSALLNVTCQPGFVLRNGSSQIFCYDGIWSNSMPSCVRVCRLKRDASVQYHCSTPESERFTVCNDLVPSGTVVKPVCRAPHYYYPGQIFYMYCIDGTWDRTVECQPDCGKITPDGQTFAAGGRNAYRGELPWHAGIYDKTKTAYQQICGGSLVSTTAIISAAHCFWSDKAKLLPASNYAVAVGKIYPDWDDSRDEDAQKSDVADIKITPYFKGGTTNYQDDIAVVVVATPFTYQTYIRPVCLDYTLTFNERQLYDGNLGKVAGWGLVDRNGTKSKILQVVELPFVSTGRCYELSPLNFREFITNDKICAGYTNGTALCQGDSGGGLAFPAPERDAVRYYLRGVVSTAPRNEYNCSTNTFTTFTQIIKHENFISSNIYGSPSKPNNRGCSSDMWLCDGNRCIPSDKKCNGVRDCADGTDEAETICASTQLAPGNCVLPAYPAHGTYHVAGDKNAAPGKSYRSVFLNITCDSGYGIVSDIYSLRCYNGTWSADMPACTRFCTLSKHPSVDYQCEEPGTEFRECELNEPPGTKVRPTCKRPNYYHQNYTLDDMVCRDGKWSYIAKCKPECGKVTPQGMTLVAGGKSVKRGELPWLTAVYKNTSSVYELICSGTLISTKSVITAAHCFWSGSRIQSSSNYAVAVGKVYRDWNDNRDEGVQTSSIDEIKVPHFFKDSESYYQGDIAVVILTTPITYQVNIRPICINFDEAFNTMNFNENASGKVAGWGEDEHGIVSSELKVADVRFVPIETCYSYFKPNLRNLVTFDRVCANYPNATALWNGDSGAGLAYIATDTGTPRYYLRGVASTSIRNINVCNAIAQNTYTDITKYFNFVDQVHTKRNIHYSK